MFFDNGGSGDIAVIFLPLTFKPWTDVCQRETAFSGRLYLQILPPGIEFHSTGTTTAKFLGHRCKLHCDAMEDEEDSVVGLQEVVMGMQDLTKDSLP